MKRSIKERPSSEDSIKRLLMDISARWSPEAVLSIELTCFLRLLSQNFDATVIAIMITTKRTRKLTMKGASMFSLRDLHDRLEDRSRQLHARGSKPLVKLW